MGLGYVYIHSGPRKLEYLRLRTHVDGRSLRLARWKGELARVGALDGGYC